MPQRTAARAGDQARLPQRLSRERIVAAAVEVADAEGIRAVSMRRLGQELGVDPMSLYRHVGDKDGLLDAMTDAVIAGIEPATGAKDSLAAARAMMLHAREAMRRHPWAPGVLKERPTPTPAGLRHLDGFVGVLRDGGFSIETIHHAIHVLGSRILGFAQDLYDDGEGARVPAEEAELQARTMAATLPHLAELALAVSHTGPLGGCDDDAEFAFALDLALEGLERRDAARRG